MKNLTLMIALLLCPFVPIESRKMERKGEDYQKIYLASYPRAGNHWVRYLLEEATGVATSSVYCDIDPRHLPTLFPWNGYVCDQGYEGNRRYPEEGETVFLKTHYPAIQVGNQEHEPPKGKAVRIVRHPIDSIYAYYSAFSTPSHPPLSPIPQQFLLKGIHGWRTFQEFWNGQVDVLTLKYEDLMSDPYRVFRRILIFSGIDPKDEKIFRAIERYPPNNVFLKHAIHYTQEQLDLIAKELGPLLVQFNYSIL